MAQKLAEARGVDVKCLELGSVEKVSGTRSKRSVTVEDRRAELGEEDRQVIEDSKLRVQASIQGDAVRVSGAQGRPASRTRSRWCARV